MARLGRVQSALVNWIRTGGEVATFIGPQTVPPPGDLRGMEFRDVFASLTRLEKRGLIRRERIGWVLTYSGNTYDSRGERRGYRTRKAGAL